MSSVTHERARVAHATRFHGPDAPQTALARRDLRAANLEAAIRRAVAEAPPLTRQTACHGPAPLPASWRATACAHPGRAGILPTVSLIFGASP